MLNIHFAVSYRFLQLSPVLAFRSRTIHETPRAFRRPAVERPDWPPPITTQSMLVSGYGAVDSRLSNCNFLGFGISFCRSFVGSESTPSVNPSGTTVSLESEASFKLSTSPKPSKFSSCAP